MAFASVVAAAHACTFRDVMTHGFADAASTGTNMPNCDDVPASAGADANVCAFHCVSGNLLDVPSVAALSVAPSALRVDAPDPLSGARTARPYEVTALAAAPPPLLRFARLLI
jgi:hypothetical protein